MIKQNKAQVIIITLWIMIILSLLAISVANRVSMGLRLSRYARDGIKADALALAGINQAVTEINSDTNRYDALSESWANDEKKFKEIRLDDNNDNEVFSVVYDKIDPAGKSVVVYGVSDEDSKININAADENLLKILLEEFNIVDAGKLARNIIAWRGDPSIPVDDPARDYSLKGYSCKAKPFANIEELLPVNDMSVDTYNSLKAYITTNTDSGQIKININTVSPEILAALIKYAINSSSFADAGVGDKLFNAIIAQRNLAPFDSLPDIAIKLNLPDDSQEYNIFNYLQGLIDVQSQYFHITSIGIVKKPLLSRRIECIYNKAAGKCESWHQN